MGNLLQLIAIFGTLALIATTFLRMVWQKYTTRGLAFLCLGIFGMAMMGITALFATAPSNARRITAVGRCEDFRDVSQRANTRYLFDLVANDGSQIQLETHIDPHFSGNARFLTNGELLQVTYLDKETPNRVREAIALTILSGQNAGWHRAVDADWMGAWLMFPTGAIVCAYAAFQMMRNRRSVAPALVQSEDQPELTNLGL